MKKTPTTHPDYEPVKAALDLMKSVCSNVNETKRQLEQLEKLEDLQATIANWEVSFFLILLLYILNKIKMFCLYFSIILCRSVRCDVFVL